MFVTIKPPNSVESSSASIALPSTLKAPEMGVGHDDDNDRQRFFMEDHSGF